MASRVNAEDTRDRIINMYKDEIKIQSTRDRDFKQLVESLGELQRRIKSSELTSEDARHE